MSEEAFNRDQVITDPQDILSVEPGTSGSHISSLLPLDEWVEQIARTDDKSGLGGVILKNTDSLDALVPELHRLQLICIEFPDAVDGRGYTQASLLRNRYGYRNELRAIGEVLVDQLFLLKRVGFDSFALEPEQELANDSYYLNPFSVTYQ
jgi:uncharacterized protein (DUF934 family)